MDKPDKMLQVRFLPEGIRGVVTPGTQVDQAARNLGTDLQSVCGGHGKCGKCRVRLLNPAGFGQPAKHLSPPTHQEANLLSDKELSEGWRLACQSRILTDVTFNIPEESRSGRQVIRKASGSVSVALDPAVRLRAMKVPVADLKNPSSDWKRLASRIAFGSGEAPLYPDVAMLKTLPEILSRGEETSAVFRKDGECIGLMAHSGRCFSLYWSRYGGGDVSRRC